MRLQLVIRANDHRRHAPVGWRPADPAYFSQVRVDEEAGTIVWPNGADLDPLVLHSKVTGIPIALDSPKRMTG